MLVQMKWANLISRFSLGRTWEEPGKSLGRTREEPGKNPGRAWEEPGKSLGRTWEEPGKEVILCPWYSYLPFPQVRSWLKGRAEEIIATRSDIGDTMESSQGLLEQHEKFEAKARVSGGGWSQLVT